MRKLTTSFTVRDVFIDTSGFYSLIVENDIAHRDAVLLLDDSKKNKFSFVTTDYILDETATLLKARGLVHVLPAFFESVLSSNICRIEWTDSDRFIAAKNYFIRHEDKDYSFTDCVSFVTMSELKLKRVLTSDRHFLQAGFEPVLKTAGSNLGC
jgi:predicted nucleic acid-binding protein